MRPKTFDFDPDNTDDDGIFTNQSISSSGDLTFDGVLASGGEADLDYARRIDITSSADDSGLTFTITGTDCDGLAISEAVSGANTATATSSKYFKVVTNISVDGASAGNVKIGTTDEFKSNTIPLDHKSDLTAKLNTIVTGTIDYTVQETFSDIHTDEPDTIQSASFVDISALADKTAAVKSEATRGASAIQFVVNSFTDTAEVQMYLNQPSRITDGI